LNAADFSGGWLNLARLTGATINGANLYHAQLDQTRFGRVDFSGTIFCRTGVDLARIGPQVTLGCTTFSDLSLAPFCRAKTRHVASSFVDFASILRSIKEPNLPRFLRDTGMPEVFVQYNIDCAKSLSPDMTFSLLQSTFISNGCPDEAFARRLNKALKAAGVTTFFFTDDAVPGDELPAMMRRGVNEHDRVILVCSKASLKRPGLLNELKEALRREARDSGRSYLIPVALDDFVFTGWKPQDKSLNQSAVTDRVVADFRNPASFDASVAKLITALKRP
jgi:hypothetical protein